MGGRGGAERPPIAEASRRLRVTPYVVGVSAFLRALSVVLEDPEVVVGTAFAGRLSGKSVEAVGYFSTTVFIGATNPATRPASELIREVNELVARWHGAPRRQWEELLGGYDAADLYPVKFSCEPAAMSQPDARFPGVRVTRLDSGRGASARRPMDVNVLVDAEGVEFHARYRRDVVDEEFMDRLVKVFAEQLWEVSA